jgi:hypothetical protein
MPVSCFCLTSSIRIQRFSQLRVIANQSFFAVHSSDFVLRDLQSFIGHFAVSSDLNPFAHFEKGAVVDVVVE